MKFERTETWGFEHAIRGMRNPLESWDKSDSGYTYYPGDKQYDYDDFKIGPNDLNLMQRLIKGGAPHCKFMRQIMVSVDITAPLYWWKEFDTYKIGTTANSTSTMHKLATTPITKECFEMDDYENITIYDREPYNPDAKADDVWEQLIEVCETLRKTYLKTKDKKYWKELIRILPESWLQTRTVTMNYENLRNIVYWRKGHKLTEWHQFLDWAHTLPYADELIFIEFIGD